MKKGTLMKVMAVSMSCVLVAGVTLTHTQKSNASEVEKAVQNSANQELDSILSQLDCVKDIQHKKGTTEYVFELNGKEVTYSVSGTENNRKVVQTTEGSRDQMLYKKANDKVEIVEKTYENNKNVTTKLGEVNIVEETGASRERVSEEKKASTIKTFIRMFNKKYKEIDYWYIDKTFDLKFGNKGDKTKYKLVKTEIDRKQSLIVNSFLDDIDEFYKLKQENNDDLVRVLSDTGVCGIRTGDDIYELFKDEAYIFAVIALIIVTGVVLINGKIIMNDVNDRLNKMDVILDEIGVKYTEAAKCGVAY